MRRRDFLSRLGIGAAVAVAAPQIAKAVTKKEGLVVEKEVSEEVYDVYQNWPTQSWYEINQAIYMTQDVFADDDVSYDTVRIYPNMRLDVWETVYIDAEYTNKDIIATFIVTKTSHDHALIMPLDGTVRVVKDIPKEKIFFTGDNFARNISVPVQSHVGLNRVTKPKHSRY